MKTKLLISLFISCLFQLNNLVAQTPITIYTPKGSALTATQRPETLSPTDKADLSYWVAYYYPDAQEINAPSATTTYNCHSYAWNKSEGGPTCAVAWDGDDTNESIYWTDGSYVETIQTNGWKVSYTSTDHSAIKDPVNAGKYISKWGDYPLMRHDIGYGPYDMSSRKYYVLDPRVSGSISLMCVGNQRTYAITGSISGSTYSWSKDASLFNQVSGTNTASTYTVSATSGTGNAWVAVQTTTPSGQIATTPYFYAWVGKAQVQSISGPSSVSRNIQYMYYANANNSSGTSYNWSVSPSGPYLSPSGGEVNSCGATFYTSGSYQLLARAVNACGTSTWSPKSVYVGSGKMLTLYPNPASDNVSITVNEDPQIYVANDTLISRSVISNSSNVEPKTYTIRIFNNQSTLLSTCIRSGKYFSVPLTNMREGTYIIEVSEGNNRYTQQLIVKHQ